MTEQKRGVINWRDLIPEGWSGRCCYCGALLTEVDWSKQSVVAVASGNGLVVLCLCHMFSTDEEYAAAILELGKAVAERLQTR